MCWVCRRHGPAPCTACSCWQLPLWLCKPAGFAAVPILAFQCVQASWTSPLYSMQLLAAPAVALQACWRDEDAFFQGVADWDLLPIDTRRPFGFYYAHLASFGKLKMFPEVRLSSVTQLQLTCGHNR